MDNTKLARRKFLRQAFSGSVGFALAFATHNTLHGEKAEAINWLAAAATGVTLINGLFKLGENIRGLLQVQNNSGRSERGYVKYEIIDTNRNVLEVSEGQTITARPGYTPINFSCTACPTPGNKLLIISTGYNSVEIPFNVTGSIPNRNTSYCHSHYPYPNHCHDS